MRMVAFITEGRVIRRILDHPAASARRAIRGRAPLLAASTARAFPRSPAGSAPTATRRQPHGRTSSSPRSGKQKHASPSWRTGSGNRQPIPERSRLGAASPRCRPRAASEPASAISLTGAQTKHSSLKEACYG